MPRLTAAELPTKTDVEFTFSPALDMINAMYFTRFVIDSEGVEGWPVELRTQMAPDLLAELDFLYSFPNGAGMMGHFGDMLFNYPETWESVDKVVDFIRNIPAGLGPSEQEAGIQGLSYYVACTREEPLPPMSDDPREALRLKIASDGVEGVDAVMDQWDRPEELRERMITLVQRFYEEHYKHELPKRRAALERSAAAHRGISREETIDLIHRITSRPRMCLEDVCNATYERLVLMPSLDMGPYMSCAALKGPHPVHGMFYQCEAEFISEDAAHANDIQRTARMYKALSDEQRLRILHMLRDREMYAQEIVEQTGLHQSVVSRHLMLMRAVGLLTARKQNNMKFFSLNPEIRGQLTETIDLFTGAR
ncbi:MAG: metalloregulator ArsR/SmtB family transcription factor [Dehalococcoidia bacterium]